ncbi:MAG: hypothetical protein PHZ04_03230 [Patescibacteria group bacterium]|nr:hypothetical protein [Patescibacteria group bacterium]MDD5294660.1 hypothetical protein [Patescibacteria group bacterium]MDD5554712.1 hypothetical protein [Patescibacteria group bacterium]
MRILGSRGRGLKKKAILEYNGVQEEFTTTSQGNFVSGAIIIPPKDKEIYVKGIVSGIQDPVILHVRRPRPPSTAAGSCWSPLNNNGRARYFLIAAVLFWIFCLKIGFGGPLIDMHLSDQQLYYNELVSEVNPGHAFVSTGNWNKVAWLFTFIWTIFAILYAILSFREEIAEEVAQILDGIVDKPYVTASDPLMERIASWSGGWAIGRKMAPDSAQPSTAAGSAQPSTAGPAKSMSFWRLLQSEFLAEILADILLPAVANVFMRR